MNSHNFYKYINNIMSFSPMKNYKFIKILGYGTFGSVLLIYNQSENIYRALKVITKEKISHKSHNIKSEIYIQSIVKNNPFIVQNYDYFQNEQYIFYIMEYIQGYDLFECLYSHNINKNILINGLSFTKLNDDAILFISSQLIIILEFLLSNNIMHRDLKLENIMLSSDGYIKLIDFNLSKIFPHKYDPSYFSHKTNKYYISNNFYDFSLKKTYSFCGTDEYLSPEKAIIKIQPKLPRNGYSFETDYWSLGIILYELAYGYLPFNNKNKNKIIDKIINDEPKFKNNINPVLKDFIFKLLIKDPTKRLGYNSFSDIKNHTWFNSVDWNIIKNKIAISPFSIQKKPILSSFNFIDYNDDIYDIDPNPQEISHNIFPYIPFISSYQNI
jgi:serine/threonine protein kinase